MLVACSTQMRAIGDAPFDLEGMQSATFTQTANSAPAQGVGGADLLVSSEVLRCGQDIPSEGSTIELRLGWMHQAFDPEDSALDQGWEGVYLEAQAAQARVDQGAVRRTLFVVVYTEGERWDLAQFPGQVELREFGEPIVGSLDHQWLRGRFEAERCEQQSVEDTGA